MVILFVGVGKLIIEVSVTVLVSDVYRALEFYTGLLGLRLKKRYNEKYAEVEADGVVLGLHRTSENVSGGNVSVGFRVEDLERQVTELRGKGLVFSSPIQEGEGGWFAYFQDPDGTPLYLWQRNAAKTTWQFFDASVLLQ